MQQAPIAGFQLTSYPDLVTADRMHVDAGLWKHLVTYLRQHLGKAATARVDQSLSAARPFEFLHRPTGGLRDDSNLKTAAQTASLGKLLPVSLLADKHGAEYVPVVTGKLTPWKLSLCHHAKVLWYFATHANA